MFRIKPETAIPRQGRLVYLFLKVTKLKCIYSVLSYRLKKSKLETYIVMLKIALGKAKQ